MERESLTKVGALFIALSALGLAVFFSRPAPLGGKTVVRYLTYETGPAQMALVREIERRFEQANPDVDVQVEFNQTARDKIYVELASGTAPDTFYAVTDDLPRLAVKGAIEPLTDWLARDTDADMGVFFPEIVDALRYAPPYQNVPVQKRPLYAYPIHWSTDILFYNKDLFDAAGIPYPTESWTWKDMISAAQRLTRKDARGRTEQFGMFLPDPTTTIQSNGGDVFNEDYTRCTINSPEALEALTTMRNLRFKLRVAPDPAQVQETSSMQLFKLGRMGMLPGRTYMAVDFNKIKDFTYDAALMPGMKQNVERLAVGGMCMARQSKVKDAAWRWMRFYCSPEGGQQVLGKEKNAVTAVKDFATSREYFLQPPPQHAEVFITSLNDARITVPPIVNASEYINRIRNPMFDDMMRDPNLNIAQKLKEYEDATNQLLLSEPKQDAPAAE